MRHVSSGPQAIRFEGWEMPAIAWQRAHLIVTKYVMFVASTAVEFSAEAGSERLSPAGDSQ